MSYFPEGSLTVHNGKSEMGMILFRMGMILRTSPAIRKILLEIDTF